MIALAALALAAQPGADSRHEQGRALYNYRCYVCHGYSGDAETMAATALHPPPRSFRTTAPADLPRARMIDAVTHGRPGTGMTSFTRVLDPAEIELVVDFVRAEFMVADRDNTHYHTVENGWPDHDRYAAAFPFARGELAVDTPFTALTDAQRAGRELFVSSCVVCHDRAPVLEEGPTWSARSVSWPRNLYDHRDPTSIDALSSATFHAREEVAPPLPDGASEQVRRGERLFQDNCAFCHGAAGTGQNWIGTFLVPPPRDLTAEAGLTADRLRHTIREGIDGTSMPAWKHVWGDEEIDAVVAYALAALTPGATSP